ncbi:MAG: hypothetical protein ACEY3H_04665 [Wolbachia sp.]|uniref:hypothetical protein n=1 Tax=Wolbachia endosymbiont (group A) of Anoplius nigerrimus TaxID=2953979 RepID=UPI002231308F|nr:hypothetical protein [Wolbachia endosymbiont (group A) of Anoplius nigerrimus]
MLNINNTVNYEINVKQKYSWSTVFAWLYLKTIGRILPKKWNKWAENILSNKVTFQDMTMQTECIETTDKSVGADLKPEVVEKGSQSEVISKDGEVQTNKVTFQDTTMQTECVETTDKSFQVNLRPEVAEEESQSEVMSEDEGIQTEVSDEFIDEDYDSMEEVSTEEDEELNEQLEDISQELELERSQNILLKEENEELRSKLAECEKDYTELEDVSGQLEEELSAESKEKSKLIFGLSERLIKCNIESLNEIKRPLVEVEKDIKINSLMRLNEGLDEDKKEMEAKVEDLRKHLQSAQESKQQLEKERIDLESKLKDLSSQLSTVVSEKKDLENKVARLQEQVEHLNAELERVRSIAISSIGECTKTLDENLKLKNQQIESSTTEHGQQNAKEKSRNGNVQKGQTKVQKPDAESCMGTVSKTTNRIKGIPNSLINSSVSVQQSGKIR